MRSQEKGSYRLAVDIDSDNRLHVDMTYGKLVRKCIPAIQNDTEVPPCLIIVPQPLNSA